MWQQACASDSQRHRENEPSFNLSATDTKGQSPRHAEWSPLQIAMPTRLAVFIPNSQSHKIIGCVGQQLWCHFLYCRHTQQNVLSCLSPSLGCSCPPWAPCEPLLDKTHYPSLLLFRKLIIPSITSGLSDNRMNMPSHRLIRSLCLEFVGEHNSSPRRCISCNYLSNMTSLVWQWILLLVIIDSLFVVYTLKPSDSNISNLPGSYWSKSSASVLLYTMTRGHGPLRFLLTGRPMAEVCKSCSGHSNSTICDHPSKFHRVAQAITTKEIKHGDSWLLWEFFFMLCHMVWSSGFAEGQ